MQYGKPAAGLGSAVAGNAALAFTGFYALLWAEAALVLIFLGLVLLRVQSVRRRRQ